MGCDIITGGGPGLMQAANEGAASSELHRAQSVRRHSRRLAVRAGRQSVRHQAFEHKTFFTRLHHFVLTSDAFVVAPGGIGTVLELMMIWQLLQVRHVRDTPLILVGKMWADLVDWARTHLLTSQPPLANPEDMAIPALREHGRRGDRADPRASCAVAARNTRPDTAINRAANTFIRRGFHGQDIGSKEAETVRPRRLPLHRQGESTTTTTGTWSSTMSSPWRTPASASASRRSPARCAICSPSAGC